MSQPAPFREQLKALESLQELDLRIDALARQRQALPEALAAAETKLAQLRLQISAKEKVRDELEKNRRENQGAQELNQDRLKRAEEKLSGVGDTHQFQAASKELEQLKKLATELAAQHQKLGADVEAVGREISALGAQIGSGESEVATHRARLDAEGGRIDAELARLRGDRGEFTPRVDRRVLAQYDRVRGARQGLGFVPALAGRCKGCQMALPPQMFNEIQRASEFHACPSCHRLLYAPQA